ncbi:unnamed protein product [Hermetia illucens]|uniref:C2H2-type domain-containing protein n=2 Tax=Hermetia illucens TaxID=343691 RepID=A0A7R8UB21_HERIL|nr:unnamed protein product [Hermetia illucens]
MYRHMKGHGDIRPHSCRICGKAFAQAANLNRHYSVHNGERPFSCTVCNKSFTQQGNLRRHELVHTGEKPFRCKRCGRMFSQRINLKKHVMLHQGYRPFTCEICNKSFLQLQNYKKHLQRHEEKGIKTEENDVLYECAMCGVVFNNFADFQGHEIFCEVAGEEQVETTTFDLDEQQQDELEIDQKPIILQQTVTHIVNS